jgi:hypothetical protein
MHSTTVKNVLAYRNAKEKLVSPVSFYGATTISIMRFSKMTLSIRTRYHFAEGHYAEFRISFCVMLNLIMLNVVLLNVIMLNVIILSVVMLNVIMLSVVAPPFYTPCLKLCKQRFYRIGSRFDQNVLLSFKFLLFHFYTYSLTQT